MSILETLNNGESGLIHRTKINDNFTALNTDKVEKVTGKDLSTNDFSDAYKNKIDGIEAGAEANTLNDIIAGTNVTIDKTDPLNPVINSTGGGGGGSGDVVGPASSTDSSIALFDGVTGKLLKDSSKTIVTTLGGDDTTVPTSKAVADAIGGAGGGDMLKTVYDPQNINLDAFDRANHTGTQSIDTIAETATKKVMTADERTQINTSRSSYVISSSVSINAGDNTKFDFSATGVVKEGNTIYPINISQTAISPTFLATEKVTFILVDKNGNLVQQSSPATSAQIKTHLAEWVIVHSNNTTVNAVNNNSLNGDNELNQFQSYARNFGYVNLNGNRYSANGTNLKIDKSAGRIMFPGLGQNNEKEQIAQTALSFRIRNQDGSETTDITDLDVVNYDNGGVTTVIPGATNSVWAVYRIYLFADSNITRLARPQFYYDTKEEAQLSFRNENFILEKNLDDNGMLAGYILFRKNTTNLSDTDNEFISAEGSGSFGGTSFIPTLQASYNVSPQPQIITNNGSFQLQGGETDTDDVLEIKDTGGTTTATIQANGVPTKGTDLVRKAELDTKQETLVSGTNIKTINSESILGSGNIEISGGGDTIYIKLVSSGSAQSISPDTETKIVNLTVDENIGGGTFSSGNYTVPQDGLYLINGINSWGNFSGSTSTYYEHRLILKVNSSTVISDLERSLPGSFKNSPSNRINGVFNLTQGDILSFFAYQEGTSNADILSKNYFITKL